MVSVKINDQAPWCSGLEALVDGKFTKINLGQYEGKYIVLFFYPLDFTFVCPTEIVEFSNRIEEFKLLNCEVIGVSVDSIFSHYHWTKMERKKGGIGKVNFPLVSDIKKALSNSYGVLADDGTAYRGLFILDPEKKIRIIQVNDMPIGRNVDEVLRLVEAIQFYEKNGEVCPVGWKKGKKTIKPTVDGSLEYFEAKN